MGIKLIILAEAHRKFPSRSAHDMELQAGLTVLPVYC